MVTYILMETIIHIVGYLIQLFIILTMVVYAPFSKSWLKAICSVFIVSTSWVLVRAVSILLFNESSPPLLGFVVLPIACVFYTVIIRGIKCLVFMIPYLHRLEQRVNNFIAKKGKAERVAESQKRSGL